MPGKIHTVGLGGRPLSRVLELLRRARVTRVVDVRRYGSSDRHAHLAAPALHAALREAGIEVHDLGDLLGGDRRGGYPRHMGTAGFRKGLARLEALALEAPTAILCAERDPERCHRRFLAGALEKEGWTVVHHLHTMAERAARGDLRLVGEAG